MAGEQFLQLTQMLRLSPTLLQSMNILQMNTLELRDYLNELALENPVMEYSETGNTSWEEFASQVPWAKEVSSFGGGDAAESDAGGPSTDRDATDSLDFVLRDQLERLDITPELLALCRYMIELLDDHGRFEEEDLEHLGSIGIPPAMLEEGIRTIQGLEPAGVGARSAGESLALQLARLPGDHTAAITICMEHLELLAAQRYRELSALLSVSGEEIAAAAELIRSLSPNPVGEFAPEPETEYVRPDAWVAEIDGALQIFINRWDLPQFSVSSQYQEMYAASKDSETREYLEHRLRQAKWVMDCVNRRQNTLRACLTALVNAQDDFFLGRAEAPGPLRRRELAELLELHPSTVTRALRHKYLQCRQGLFPLSFFFSGRIGGGFSEQFILRRLAALLRDEDPFHPLSDQRLAELLEAEGIGISRRTVAKYRDGMHIPSSFRRKRKPEKKQRKKREVQ